MEHDRSSSLMNVRVIGHTQTSAKKMSVLHVYSVTAASYMGNDRWPS